MDLKYALEASEEFAGIVWSRRREMGIWDLMLYGSVARNEPKPEDVDLLVLHKNPKLDRFQSGLRNGSFQSSNEALKHLETMLGINLTQLLRETKARILIHQGLFHTAYLNEFYFTDDIYRRTWDRAQENQEFTGRIFDDGLLWNPRTKHYDIPAKSKYQIPNLVKVP